MHRDLIGKKNRIFCKTRSLCDMHRDLTRHENFHGKFSLCAEHLIRSVSQEVLSRLKVYIDYSEMFI